MRLKCGLIGCGHWGPNYARLLHSLPEAELIQAADLNPERLARLQTLYPALLTSTDVQQLLQNPEIQAVIIATPASSHYELVKQALLAGKHVLSEKPLTLTTESSAELAKLAAEQQLILMVGHTFLFNSGIRYLKTALDQGELGQLYYLQATRTNLGPIRNDVDAVADLATHDIAIFNYLIGSLPEKVSAQGQSWLQPGIADLAFITLHYPGQRLAQVHASWLNPVKVRQLTLVGSQKMMSWDDLNGAEPIRIYDVGVHQEPYYQDFGQFQLLPRQGDTTIPRVILQEPLRQELLSFIEAIQQQRPPLSDAYFAVGVSRVLEAVQTSMAQAGQAVLL